MKISQEYIGVDQDDVLEIVSAKYLGNYVIEVVFNDNESQEVNFQSFLEKSLHPSVSKYLDEDLFSDFKVTNGNLNWNDYDLIFSLEDLHSGIIS